MPSHLGDPTWVADTLADARRLAYQSSSSSLPAALASQPERNGQSWATPAWRSVRPFAAGLTVGAVLSGSPNLAVYAFWAASNSASVSELVPSP